MFVPRTIVGAALLAFGRKAFWVFVAGVGFLAGLHLATQIIHFESAWMVFGIAVAGGLIGAFLALLLQNIGVFMAGFVGGGYVAMTLVESMGWDQGLLADLPYRPWMAFLVGGILGAVLLGALFDWALIILSSVIGATLVTPALPISGIGRLFAFVVLVAVGVVIQVILMRREHNGRPSLSKRKPGWFG
jgi:hypothetical protein